MVRLFDGCARGARASIALIALAWCLVSVPAAIAAPVAVTGSASDLAATSAVLNGTATLDATDVYAYFELGTTTSYGRQTPGDVIPAGGGATPFSDAIGGLTGSTTYHYRLVLADVDTGAPITTGADATFTTPVFVPPVVTTTGATDVHPTTATLNGTVDPNGSQTTYQFEYGTSTAYGAISDQGDAGSGTDPVDVGVPVVSLLPSTLYHFRLVALDGNATVVATGADQTFTTPAPTWIASTGPLTRIDTSPLLNCAVNHAGDLSPEFFGDTACGTFVATGGQLYGPAPVPAGSGLTGLIPYTAVSQSAVTGSGTVADPYKLITVVDAGSSGLRLTQTDSYVEGQESFRTDVKVQNTGAGSADARIWRAGDCYLQNSDSGWGAVDGATGAVSCVAGTSAGPGARIEQWYPLSPGSSYFQAGYSEVWSRIGAQQAFPNTCRCGEFIDNGAGLSWDATVPAGGSVTKSSLITFSPLGNQPLTVTKTATTPSTVQGGTNGYTITIANPNASPVTLNAVTDDLPAGFTYVPGSTTGSTTNNPTAAGGTLTWAGPIQVPAGGAATVTFNVVVSPTLGVYTNQAAADAAGGFTVVPSGPTAPVEVIANPTPPTISIDDVAVVEGNAGTVIAQFTVSLSHSSAGSVGVNFATADGSAVSPGDYASTSGALTFSPGQTSKTVTVPVVGDTLDESDETFTVGLSGASNATIADASGVGTITDDDAAPSLSVSDVTVTEGNAGTVIAQFTVSLSAVSGRSVGVNFATADGTAVSPGDYASTSGALTFGPGQTSKTVTVPVVGDTLDEADETFTVGLSGASNATIADASGVGTITDDDAAPSLSVSDVTVTEGNAGTVIAQFTVSLSAVSGRSVGVNFATADGTAVSPGDYASTSGALTFGPGQTSKTVTVPVVGDTLDEADETFTVGLSGASNATIADASGVGTITDDDAAPSLSVSDVTVTEGNAGTVIAQFTVSLSAVSGRSVGVNFATADGTAVAPGDYASTSGALTFSPGQMTKTVTVAVAGDTEVESDETFTVGLSGASNATIADASGVGTITDDDAPSLSIDDVAVVEGNAGTVNAQFTVSLSHSSAGSVGVNFATADGSAVSPGDYASTSGGLTFGPGQTSKTVTVAVVGDVLDEVDETFTVGLSGASNATIADASGVGTITDDDAAPSLSVSDVTVTEGNSGTVNAQFTVSLSAVSGRSVGVNFATADGTAVAPGDYASTSGALTFGPGQTSKTVTVAVAGDTLDEPDETFTVGLSGASNATTADASGVGTITDDDPAPSGGTAGVSTAGGSGSTSGGAPEPVLGDHVVGTVTEGTVIVTNPGGKPIRLGDGRPVEIKLGARVDCRKGHVRITAASDSGAGRHTGEFYGGIFTVTQDRHAPVTTVLRLVENVGLASCPNKRARRAGKQPKSRKRFVWGDGSGRFRTVGYSGAATVRGTKWLTSDSCAGTLVRVERGVVDVRDQRRHMNVRVTAGHRYLARRR